MNDRELPRTVCRSAQFGSTSTQLEDPPAVVASVDSEVASMILHRRRQHQYAEKLYRISHILHYCSIAILGIFAFQVTVKQQSCS